MNSATDWSFEGARLTDSEEWRLRQSVTGEDKVKITADALLMLKLEAFVGFIVRGLVTFFILLHSFSCVGQN